MNGLKKMMTKENENPMEVVEKDVPANFTNPNMVFSTVIPVNESVYRIGNILVPITIFNSIFVQTNNVNTDLIVKINKISDTLWKFEEKNNIQHQIYAITGLNSINDMRIESINISNYGYNINGLVVAKVRESNLDISGFKTTDGTVG